MVNTYIRARSPKGNVGVTDVVDAGELSAYSAGVLSGFNAASAASWTLQIGGVSGTQDVAIAKNPGGESELFSGTAGQSIAFVIGGAPGTPGQSRTDALVIYKDPFTTSVVNNGVDVVDYQVVAGTAATTGTQVPPSMATIRSTIPTGSLKFVAVIGYVTIAYGASSVTTGNFYKNPALLQTQVVANATARALITPVEGMHVFQNDTNALYLYDGTNWVMLSPYPTGAATAIVNTSETTTSTSYVKLATATDAVTVNIGPSGMALVTFKAINSNSAVNYNYAAVALSGANTLTAANAETAGYHAQEATASSSNINTTYLTYVHTGLTAGSTTFSAYYRTSAGTATYKNRVLSVVPL